MKVRTIKEAQLVEQMVQSLSHEQQVVFNYPEHASNSIGIADIKMLQCIASRDMKKLKRYALVLEAQLNNKLTKNGLKEQVHSWDVEEAQYAALWFYEDDASRQKQAWLVIKLEQSDVTMIFVDYGSPLHHQWNALIRD